MGRGRKQEGRYGFVRKEKPRGRVKCTQCTGHYPPTLYVLEDRVTGEVHRVGRKCAARMLQRPLWLPRRSAQSKGTGDFDPNTNSSAPQTPEIAAPRWAGFMALVNEQAVAAGGTEVGFLNPALYTLGQSADSANFFHDTTSGNNVNPYNVGVNAVTGYDLVTGWGSPTGQALIDALASPVPAGFRLSTAENYVSTRPGDVATVTIHITPQGGFSGSVNLAVSGAPSGVTASFSTNPATGSSVLTLAVSPSTLRQSCLLTITGVSGSLSSTATVGLEVNGPGFSIAPSPFAFIISPGVSGSTKIIVTEYAGFSAKVDLAVTSVLPTGVTAVWSENPTNSASVLTLRADASVTPGNYTVLVTGRNGNLTANATVTLVVYPPDFYLHFGSLPSNMARGQSVTATVAVVAQGSFSGTVRLSAPTLPTGVTATFNPTSITESQTSQLTLTVAANAPTGTGQIVLEGDGDQTGAQEYRTLDVTEAPTPAFGLTAVPHFLNLTQGGFSVPAITLNQMWGFNGAVNLSFDSLPPGVTAVFNPQSTTGSCTVYLSATSTARPGFYALMVKGNSGAVSAWTSLFLKIDPSASFAIEASSQAVSLSPGSAVSDTITLIPRFGFAAPVNLTITSVLPLGVTAQFAPNPATDTSVLTLSANSGTQAGNYRVDVTGTSGGQSVKTTLFLDIGGSTATTTALLISLSAEDLTGGETYTLTARVSAGGLPVMQGQVKFCDSAPTNCSGLHLLGTAQVTAGGAAALKIRPSAGTHGYSAVYLGTPNAFPPYSSSTSDTLTLNATASTSTALTTSGGPDSYSLIATVSSRGGETAPTGTVSFLDTTMGGASLGAATLQPGTVTLNHTIGFDQQIGRFIVSEVAGDFNWDGIPDLALLDFCGSDPSCQSFGAVTILLGNQDGSFTALPDKLAAGNVSARMVSGDFNRDGILDLAVLNECGDKPVCQIGNPSSITIYLGQGDGTFIAAPASPSPGDSPSYIVVGDFNRDGIPDLVVTNCMTSSVTILLGAGDGTFLPMEDTLTGVNFPQFMAVGDFNADGDLDLAISNFQRETLSIFLGHGDGRFTAAEPTPPAGNVRALAVGDWNGDGKLDIAATDMDTNTLRLLLGNGDGTFHAAPVSPATGKTGLSIAATDFNADGFIDLAVANQDNTVSILFGNGDGTFVAEPSLPQLQQSIQEIASIDLDGDGVPDLVGAAITGPLFLKTNLTRASTATVSGISLLGAGLHGIAAEYEGDQHWRASTSTHIPLTGQDPAATPTFSVAAGTYTSTQTVTIGDSTPGAVIYYTTNGTTPTTSSTHYNGPITVGASEIIQAIATASGYWQSAVATAIYTITPPAATPSFSLDPGTYDSAQDLTISDSTPGAVIYFTTDGSTPTTSSHIYFGPFLVSNTETIQAIATATGYSQSAVAAAAYVINLPAVTASPVFSIPGGAYTSAQTVAISDSTPGATIYYTTNGTKPTAHSSVYNNPITVSSSETLEAWATASGYLASPMASAGYYITPMAVGGAAEWKWLGGSSSVPSFGTGQPGVYGESGTPASGNAPGGRDRAAVWTDSSGNVWLFGGDGFDAIGNEYFLNDLWQFNPSTNKWTWVAGSSSAMTGDCLGGTYGTLGTPAAGNIPGGRGGAKSWIDRSNNLWLFGGLGCDANGTWGYLADLWKFDPSMKEWTWMGGSDINPSYGNGQSGVYGALGTPSAGNLPGGRSFAASWMDSSGYFWLFGGEGFDVNGTWGTLNDLWKLDPSTKEWTWVGGSRTADQHGVYGALGTPAAGNSPGGRDSAVTWTDSVGNVWLFGGQGIDTNGDRSLMNDLWKLEPSTNEWTWMSGSSTVEISGGHGTVYGTIGTPALGNFPSQRVGAVGWSDANGNLWLFGGLGSDANEYGGILSDLWVFQPSTREWTWTGGSSTVPAPATGSPGLYGTRGVPAPGNIPGSRFFSASWTDSGGNFWLFGGEGFDANDTWGQLNDLWKYQPLIIALPPAAAPTFSLPAGTYSSVQTVTISDPTPGAVIYYTSDGSVPTTSSSAYSGPITVSASQTVQAIATASGYSPSAVASATFTINLPAATPQITPAGGTFTAAQMVTISDSTPGAAIYYTTNGTAPTTGSTLYSGPITVSTSQTIQAIAIASGYSQSGVVMAEYIITPPPANPTPTVNSLSPAYATAGSGALTLTVGGSGFAADSVAYWGTVALTTQFVSGTQLSVQVPAADLATAGVYNITVQTPSLGGGTSNRFQFEVDSAAAGTTPPTFTATTVTVAAGSTASYPVTIPSSVTALKVTCLNLPVGATCSYSSTSHAVSIVTTRSTPAGTYNVTVVFSETLPGAASALVVLPILLLPLVFVRRRLAANGVLLTTCLGAVLLACAASSIGCGGGSTAPPATPPSNQPTR